MIRTLTDRVREAYDPGTAPERVATILLEDFEASAAPPGFVKNLAERTSAQHAREIVTATTNLAPGSLTALTAQAELARVLDDDEGRATELMRASLAAELDPDASAFLAEHLLASGLRAEALEVLCRRLAAEPEDEDAHQLFASLMEELQRVNLAGEELRQTELEALERFGDRALLHRLWDALGALGERDPNLPRLIAATAREWLEDASAADPDASYSLDAPAEEAKERVEGVLRLAVEHAWLRSLEETEADDEEESGAEPDAEFGLDDIDLDDIDLDDLDLDDIDLDDLDLDEEDEDADAEWERSDTPMALLAREPGTPPELARAAREWYETASYGLWLLADPTPSPGVWLTEILTGARRYAAIAPEQLSGLRRWTVLLGALVAVDGVWRTTGAFVNLTPGEGDEAAAFALEAVEDMMRELTGQRAPRRSRKRRPEPLGVLAAPSRSACLIEDTEPADPTRSCSGSQTRRISAARTATS